ncbi:MAG TPA: redox-sensing transcriptional repressor Rex [Verrucomicrobiae bacterium]|nr:redox-sensing transcriptional repressor Rex [Verrucomicrobiae bacterium]
MKTKPYKAVPEPTLRRLPLYHRFLKDLRAVHREFVSCTDIGLELDLDPTQIRKDLESVGVVGRPRIGYVLADVINGLEAFLGWKNVNDAFLVGAGSMGSALLGYRKFEQCGLKIVAAFDLDPSKIGTQIHGKHVLPLSKLTDLARRMHILIGIITVPAMEAQGVADLMVAGGIRAIWNFAPVRLRVADQVIVHNEDLYCSLAALSQKLFKPLQSAAPQRQAKAKRPGVAAPAA